MPVRRDYEYYVTYKEHERRNDRWIPEIGIRIDEERVGIEYNKLEDQKRRQEEDIQRYNFMANNVHQGMAQHQIQEFIESTRLKTVEYICFGD